MEIKMIFKRELLTIVLLTFLFMVQFVLSESTINEKKVAPLNNSSSVNQAVGNVTKVNETISSTPATTTTVKSVPRTPQLSTPKTPMIPPEIYTKLSTSTESSSGSDYSYMNVDVNESMNNQTLIKNNITQIDEDHHEYYNSTILTDADAAGLHRMYIYSECGSNLTASVLLSKSHRRAVTVQLPFEFPFYGHPIKNITVATGGFLYAGDYIHSWLAATQYISPLMANFDTSLSNDSFIKYCQDEKSFHVFWEKVLLQNNTKVGPFTFSASLNVNGDITFVYYFLPIDITQIEDDKHPVKVGVSDAYIVDKTVYHARRKTIFEYHRVNFPGPKISNYTMIKLTLLQTCNTFTDCTSCLENEIRFKCSWCSSLNRCSNGVDRKRQEWTNNGCEKSQFSDSKLCPVVHVPEPQIHVPQHHSKIFSVVGVIGVVMLLVCWVLYAYSHPLSRSGQLLIQYGRPSAWSFRRGEARYTAATIHM